MAIEKNTTQDVRLAALHQWLRDTLNSSFTLIKLAGDASYRRYFRIKMADQTYVAMDAPPSHESCTSYVEIARLLLKQGVKVPEIVAEDLENGFLLLTDFGDELFLDLLTPGNVETLYQNAFQTLLSIQSLSVEKQANFPVYDEKLLNREMNLFRDWYLVQHRGIELSKEIETILDRTFALLIEEAALQPKVFVHRDYHSRNLMRLPEQAVGVLDFQDAVLGPFCYDLVSLLRDCYIDWPLEKVEAWVESFRNQALLSGLLTIDDPILFSRWFDWIGLQRHFKCIGIFSRLNKRDNKPQYLQYLPRVFNYTKFVCAKYKEFTEMAKFLEKIT